MTRVKEKAIDAWAIYEYREHPKGLYHTCFVDGYKEGYDQAVKDTIKLMRDEIEKRYAEYHSKWNETRDPYLDGKADGLDLLLSFLDELEKE